MHKQIVLILDFGSQYTQLIARRVREQNVFSLIHPYNVPFEKIQELRPSAIIFSGGPASVYEKNAPKVDPRLFTLGVPVLGICYGVQYLSHHLGGRVGRAKFREYGRAHLIIQNKKDLFFGFPNKTPCWMSHGDYVQKLPQGFRCLANTPSTRNAAIGSPEKKIYGIQFHPEVAHTPLGAQLIQNFLFRIARLNRDWSAKSFINETVKDIRRQVGGEKVILGLSGGVDSSVAALLLHKAIGKQLTCIFVDNGLLRYKEREDVVKTFGDHFHLNLKVAVAEREFLSRLAGVEDPERKRKIIGHTFIDVFKREAKKIGGTKFLAQGTLYPDVIESVSFHGGPTHVIKSHHNVGGLPKDLNLKLVEPLRELFKDEVRAVGKLLKLPPKLLERHPFPGPGLAVRILGDVTKERADLLRLADKIFIEELHNSGQYKNVWQAFVVLLPVKSVGVMGDQRTYENAVALRAVTSRDGMTADWAHLPYGLLSHVSNRIINEVRGINRVCYDVSSKPPATIEWE
jgi:GMP synthase (glutamine-hydrolysing)